MDIVWHIQSHLDSSDPWGKDRVYRKWNSQGSSNLLGT